MKIIKILNNSLVLVVDHTGYERILMGKGIGFHKKNGDIVRPEEIEKEFLLKDNMLMYNFLKLSKDVDDTLLTITNEVIKYANEAYKMEVMDYLYLALTDHFSFLVKSVKEEIKIPHFYNENIKHFYANEYKIGLKALDLLSEKTGLVFPETDASNIALHFVNAQEVRSKEDNVVLMEQLIEDMIDIVKYVSKHDLDKESLAYSRFITHLSYFIKRILKQEIREEDVFLPIYSDLLEAYEVENKCVDAIDKYLYANLKVSVNTSERSYLIIHIYRIISTPDNK